MDSWFPTFRRWAGIVVPLPALWPRRRSSWAQQQSLLRLLAVATEENLPLSPLVAAWAADESGVQKHRLRRLAELLRAGTPPPGGGGGGPGGLGGADSFA